MPCSTLPAEIRGRTPIRIFPFPMMDRARQAEFFSTVPIAKLQLLKSRCVIFKTKAFFFIIFVKFNYIIMRVGDLVRLSPRKKKKFTESILFSSVQLLSADI